MPFIHFFSVDSATVDSGTQANKEEVDSRSIFVGNVRAFSVSSYFQAFPLPYHEYLTLKAPELLFFCSLNYCAIVV